jgi:segregation and condensation protein A
VTPSSADAALVAAGTDPKTVASTPSPAGAEAGGPAGFQVHLSVFEGPFDLLLGLIGKHQLDVTEVALSQVTDEFLAYLNVEGRAWDLGQATEFLVVAATLLDLKTARLLPAADVEDEEDLALLEARDLLFARLLQYRAYKGAAAVLAGWMAAESRRFPRAVGLEERYAGLLPEVLLGLGPSEFAALAQRVMTPRPTPVVLVDHLHAPRVSVREQAGWLVERLRRVRVSTFRGLTADCTDTLTVVARFLGLLELYRDGVVAFDQIDPLGELHVRWTGTDAGDPELSDEFDSAEFDSAEFDEDDTAPPDAVDLAALTDEARHPEEGPA